MPSKNHSLQELRQQIKNAMIPLLIKTFELKFAAQQAKNPPSRLQRKVVESTESILEELEEIAQDLKLLHLWCEGCKKQVDKAIHEIKNPSNHPIKASMRPHVELDAGILRTLTGKDPHENP